MRLASLLAELSSEDLERLGAEHLGHEEHFTRASLCTTLEGVLRSYSFVRKFVGDRLPPTFSILAELLDSPGWTCPLSTFRDAVSERSRVLSERIASGDLLSRDDGLRLYRKVLLEARRNDLMLDAGESAILRVLRHELGIRPVEHFLVEHHSDFREFSNPDSALSEMFALKSAGLIFVHDSRVVLPEEVVPLVSQTLGIEMPARARRRLLEQLSSSHLAEALGECGLKTSGSREERLERLFASFVQPSEVLRLLQLTTLREICRESNATCSGSKDELVERLLRHFASDSDVPTPASPTPRPEPEPRELPSTRFRTLFASLRGADLTDILEDLGSSRSTGAKDLKVDLVEATPYSEVTLLSMLTNRALEDALDRLRLRTAGSKAERTRRLIDYFQTAPESSLPTGSAGDATESASTAPPTAGGDTSSVRGP